MIDSNSKPCFGPGRCEYRTIDTSTAAGLAQYRRLTLEERSTWYVASSGFFSVTLYRERIK